MDKISFIYILASDKNGTLYIGVTSDLKKRIYQHKNKLIEGFTSKHNVDKLVYFETFEDINSAIKKREGFKKVEETLEIEIDKRIKF